MPSLEMTGWKLKRRRRKFFAIRKAAERRMLESVQRAVADVTTEVARESVRLVSTSSRPTKALAETPAPG
jgi:hypothetical protein